MSDDPRDPQGKDEEDFEPLDRFFAPIEDVDWSEEDERERARRGRQASEEALSDEDLLPAPDIPSDPLADLDVDTEGSPMPAPGPGQEAFPVQGDRSTWTEAFPQPEPERELTLEDLKNPPPEYAELPGPPPEEEAAGAFQAAGPGATGAGPEEPGVAPDETQEFDEIEEVAPAETVVEPDLDQVEAAADRFAESLRSEEPEPGPVPTPPGSGLLPPPDQVEQDLLSDLEREPTPPPPVSVGVADSLGGPTWQEPTSQEVGPATPQAPSGGRNLPLAFVTGVVLLAIGIGSIAWGKAPFTVVVGAVIVMAQGELYAALHRRGYQPATAVGLVFGGMISAAAYLRGESGALAMFALGAVATFLWFMAMPPKARQNTLVNIAMTLLPLTYIAFLAGYVLIILAMPGGRTLTLSVIGLAVGYDIAAFAIGSLWGNRALAPSISPRKSWEGAMGATLVLLVVSIAILAGLSPFKAGNTNGIGNALGLALVIAIFAPLGDLAESLLKRDLGIKDMGSILPGHGGLLDRVDSILFAAPAAYYFFRLFLS